MARRQTMLQKLLVFVLPFLFIFLVNSAIGQTTATTDVELTFEDATGGAPYQPGDVIEYEVTITNNSAFPIAAVRFGMLIPEGMTYDPAENSSFEHLAWQNSISIGFSQIANTTPALPADIPANMSETYLLSLTVNNDALPGAMLYHWLYINRVFYSSGTFLNGDVEGSFFTFAIQNPDILSNSATGQAAGGNYDNFDFVIDAICPHPDLPTAVNGEYCESEPVEQVSVILNGTGTAVTWWTLPTGGTQITTGVSGTTFQASAVTNPQAPGPGGTLQVFVEVSDIDGCANPLRVPVTLTNLKDPQASIVNQEACSGSTVTLSPTLFFTAPQSGPISWNVTQFNGSTIGIPPDSFGPGNGNSSILPNPEFQATTPGIYTLSISIGDTNGCDDTEFFTITIDPSDPPLIEGVMGLDVCNMTTETYTVNVGPSETVTWTPPTLPSFVTGPVNTSSVTITWVNNTASPIVNDLDVEVVSPLGCIAQNTIQFTIFPDPTITSAEVLALHPFASVTST